MYRYLGFWTKKRKKRRKKRRETILKGGKLTNKVFVIDW